LTSELKSRMFGRCRSRPIAEAVMDHAAFDALSRRLARPASRRSIIAGMFAAAAPFAAAGAARKRRKQTAKCVKLGAACGGKRKCCAGECRHHVCGCPFDKRQCGNKCIESFGCCGVSECPATQDPCLEPACAANLCATKPKPGMSCEGGLKRCNDAGHCVAVTCQQANDCPGSDTACQTRVCKNGLCELEFANLYTFVTQSPLGDCLKVVCDGFGGQTTIPDDTDMPDGDECAIWCDSGIVMRTNKPAGTPCGGGNRHCDGAGRCV
jgi:hypothetical protein